MNYTTRSVLYMRYECIRYRKYLISLETQPISCSVLLESVCDTKARTTFMSKLAIFNSLQLPCDFTPFCPMNLHASPTLYIMVILLHNNGFLLHDDTAPATGSVQT